MSQLAMFSGKTFDAALDGERLNSALGKVYAVMLDHQWHTLDELAAKAGCSPQGASARCRDLRKPRFGGHVVERRRVEGGLWVYRLLM